MSEFSRPFDTARLPAGPQHLVASPQECAALAKRFLLVSVGNLEADITLNSDGAAVRAVGQLKAEVVQSCAVSGEDLPVRIAEPVSLRFVPAQQHGADEIELEAAELDEIELDGTRFDLGEALAQTLALAIDPYLEGPGADEFRRKSGLLGEGEGGAFGALKGLFDRDSE